MQFSKYVCICIPLGLIEILLNALFDIYKALPRLVSLWVPSVISHYAHTLMLIGLVALILDNLLQGIAVVSRSSAEAEYRGVANVVAELCWIRNLLLELRRPLRKASVVYCDNISAVYLSGNPVQHQRTKHIELDIHFVRDLVQRGDVRILHIPSRYQIADIFTKGLPRVLFDDFRSSLSIRPPLASTVGV
ncbi:putative RNA-directed DNA polymerase [Helianthus annuus]|nr:putative RNA-directed DNA polymerase [Helianthus annuus]